MTWYVTKYLKCAVCGTVHPYPFTAGTTVLGAHDLDMRPPYMQRVTMPAWVQECPVCGYTCRTIRKETSADREWLESEAYRSCEGHSFRSSLTAKFYRWYLNAQRDGRPEEAAYALLACVWACDDAEDPETAKTLRIQAAEVFRRVPDDENTETRLRIVMDLLRRAGQFEALINEFENRKFQDIVCRKAARTEMALAGRHDDQVHTMNLLFNNRIEAQAADFDLNDENRPY